MRRSRDIAAGVGAFAIFFGVLVAPPAAKGDDLDFDLFGDTEKVREESSNPSLGDDVARRRLLLQAHQIAGLSTLGLMTGTVVVGQLNFADLHGRGGSKSLAFASTHKVLAYTTAGAFALTGALSLLAPVPYEKDGGFDTATLHKVAVVGATLGLAGQVVLGLLTSRAVEAGNARAVERYVDIHQVTGFATVGLMAVAASVWVF